MFLGTHAPKLDDKGRVILPAKFRDELAHGLVITRGREKCLVVYSAREFESVHEQLMANAAGSKRARDAARMFLAGASEEHLDSQNRVTIPPMLRDWAGLDRDLTVIGAGNRIEVWSAAAWDAYYSEIATAYAEDEEEVIPGLF
ncbi:division/cell wall cluster transcriptional repressor MraZ [Galbitalea sp. SE-J8]|uniref:division/cell wall cluster transcriptional repressor MraZ n=1 Tax=Galbitalea sp. SE-J8 TaxID=3054952 RepID=UPI00259CD9DA|nr:division/cell wall cluster transcriptional repressor MraZ [Galbitalea sp. SE-J8]MDM4763077.1 division/cell wall cluster transcriptional repressor MraZ [Galbitalea sp. SE-J8]